MVSEEETKAIVVGKEDKSGRFAIAFDPLDGSANLDANVSVESIFGIWKKNARGEASAAEMFKPGREMIAAGYALYGNAGAHSRLWRLWIHFGSVRGRVCSHSL